MNSVTFNPLRLFSDIWRHRHLLGQLIKRDVLLRYRGAMLGVLWIFISPLIMLAIYSFVFSQIFNTRWPQNENGAPFWLLLFSGLIVFNIFSETISRSSTSVRGYPSFVKKIVFPLHILPLVPLGAALVQGIFNFLILLTALSFSGNFHAGILFTPLIIIPLILLTLGLSWFIASWGVFIRDMSQIVPVFIQMLLFLSPVFYPVSALPEFLAPLYHYNPLSIVIEATRTILNGQPIELWPWTVSLFFSITFATLGYAYFQSSRDEFADAL